MHWRRHGHGDDYRAGVKSMLRLLLTIWLSFLPLSEGAFAQTSFFQIITADNWDKLPDGSPIATINMDPEKKSVELVLEPVMSKSIWAISSDKELLPGDKGLRPYFWCKGEKPVSKWLKDEFCSSTEDGLYAFEDLLLYDAKNNHPARRPNFGIRSQATFSINILHRDRPIAPPPNHRYLYIDFSSEVYDGGGFYLIDLESFLRTFNSGPLKQESGE